MIKKLLIVGLLGVASLLNANVNAVVSILPEEAFVKAIGGDKVNVSVMVQPGNSPHTYEPKPSQMKNISKADVYYSIGVEFEEAWLPKFSNQNKSMKIINISKGINKIEMIGHHHDEDEYHKEAKEHHNHESEGLDPHTWTSPENIKVIAKNILDSLVKLDKKSKDYYQKNYENFIKSINDTDAKIKYILKDTPKGAKFMVFHPSWGYFAKEYSLKQVPIEVEGKEPKPKDIINLMKEAKKENIKAILTAPEFSDKIANKMAKELNIKVTKISPLNPNWSENLINLAKIIANK